MASEALFCGLSLALILSSETYLLARATSSASALVMLVGTQVLMCCALWAVERKTSFLDRVSPLWVCALFLLGVTWSLVTPTLWGVGPSSPLLVVPAALLFGLGNSINAYHLLDYSSLVEPDRFAVVALGGSGIAAVLNYAVSYLLTGEATTLCGVLAVVWYATSRRVYRSLASRQPFAVQPHERSHSETARFVGAFIALGFACGVLPTAVFHPQGTGVALSGLGLALSIAAIALAGLVVAVLLGRVEVSSYTEITGTLAAGGLLLYGLWSVSTFSELAAALALTCTLACACSLICLFTHTVGGAREHPGTFWGVQVAVLLCTSVGTLFGIQMPSLDLSLPMAGCFATTFFLLVFVVLFLRLWRGSATSEDAPAPREPVVANAPNPSVAERCTELARTCSLTGRERDVLELIAQGWTVDMVARQLVVSPDTVRTHLKHLYAKTGVHSRTELLDTVGVGCARPSDKPSDSV